MKEIIFVVFLLVPALASAKEKPTPNPADYTIAVHVQSTEFVGPYIQVSAHSWGWVQQMSAVIDGEKV